jgi:hypothetical protein
MNPEREDLKITQLYEKETADRRKGDRRRDRERNSGE